MKNFFAFLLVAMQLLSPARAQDAFTGNYNILAIDPNLKGGYIPLPNTLTFPGTLAGHTLAFWLGLTQVTPEMCGAVGDSTGVQGTGTDDSNALDQCFAMAMALNKRYFLSKYYRVTRQLTWDYTSRATTGVTILGGGRQMTGLIFDANIAAPNFLFTRTAGAGFYSTLRDFGVRCTTPGQCVQIGKTDFSDQHNEMVLNLVVNNYSTNAACNAIELNATFNTDYASVTNCSGATVGDGLRLRQTSFGRFFGSSGNSLNTVHITGSYNFGNVFMGMDTEVCGNAYLIDNINSGSNTIIGGTIALCTSAYNATNGVRNRVINPNLSNGAPSSIAPSTVGLYLDLPGLSMTGTPAVPASGVSIQNSSGQTQSVTLFGAAFGNVVVNGATYVGPSVANGNITIVLNPSDTISVAYSGAAPSWLWRPVW